MKQQTNNITEYQQTELGLLQKVFRVDMAIFPLSLTANFLLKTGRSIYEIKRGTLL